MENECIEEDEKHDDDSKNDAQVLNAESKRIITRHWLSVAYDNYK